MNEKSSLPVDDRIQEGVIWVLRASILVAIIFSASVGNWETAFISVLALVLTGLPLAIERRYRLNLPVEYDLVLVVFIYAGMFLGEVGNAYERFWWWDIVLHISSGVVLGFTGFLILYNLYHRQKLRLAPGLMSLFAFSFALAAGAVWEIFEFAADNLFGLNMQKSGLRDTMTDLIIDALGALVIARLAYVHVKYGSSGLVSRLIKGFLRNNRSGESAKQERR